MRTRQFEIVLYIFVCLLLFVTSCNSQELHDEPDIEVSLRMIGHQILLSSADSTSRVLPIKKENNRYRIQFESEFEFNPEELVLTIDRVVKATRLTNSYIVQVEQCETGEVVYSFKMDDVQQSDIIPCAARTQPKSCYSLLFTLVETSATDTSLLTATPFVENESDTDTSWVYYLVLSLFLLTAIAFFLLWKRREKAAFDPNLIPLGEFHFDKRNTELLIENQRIELTSKEADLLLLLNDAVNTTVEREVILNVVWGDQGGYVGRTLDVFISKLRKKLEFDTKVKIVNIRGVGYKLVING